MLRSTTRSPPCHIRRLIGFTASALPVIAALEHQQISGVTTVASRVSGPELVAALGLTMLKASADQECLGAISSRDETDTCTMHKVSNLRPEKTVHLVPS